MAAIFLFFLTEVLAKVASEFGVSRGQYISFAGNGVGREFETRSFLAIEKSGCNSQGKTWGIWEAQHF